MRRSAGAALLPALCAALLCVAAKRSGPAAGEATREARPDVLELKSERGASWTRWEASVPGQVLAEAWPATGDAREIVLLVRPPGNDPRRPLELVALGTRGQGRLARLQSGLAADLAFLDAVDLDGDGRDELITGRPRELLVLRDDGSRSWGTSPEPLVSDPDLDLRETEALVFHAPTRRLCTAVFGALRCYGRPSEPSARWGMVFESPLPVRVQRRRHALQLLGTAVEALPRVGTTSLFAAGPETVGQGRLRTLLVDPDAPEESRRVECWSRLPGAERLLEQRFVQLDGRPHLVLTTISAESLSLFGEKRLRLFALEHDRTRVGRMPVLAVESHMNLWQSGLPSVTDANGDGRDDLVLAYWKGLKDSRVVLDAYLRRPDGSFATAPVTTAFDVEDADRSMLAYADVDGDALPELLVRSARSLLVHPGIRGSKDLVARTPRWTVPLGVTIDAPDEISIGVGEDGPVLGSTFLVDGAPRLVDLDPDGPLAVVLPAKRGSSVGPVVVVELDARRER